MNWEKLLTDRKDSLPVLGGHARQTGAATAGRAGYSITCVPIVDFRILSQS
jgi:hypothetical protein